MTGSLDGSLVLPESGGRTPRVEIRNGRFAAVSQSSIILRGTNGFTSATASGGTVTASRVRELSELRAVLGNLPGQRLVPTRTAAVLPRSPEARPLAEPR